MLMKKIILYYLYTILLVPILERILFGSLDHVSFHPGIVIHMGILGLLIISFFKGKVQRNMILYMLVGFTLVYIVNLFVIEILQFSNIPFGKSISYTLKIYLLLFLSHFIYKHSDYYIKYLDNILLINSIIIILNIILGYTFQLGWQSYQSVGLEDTYRGYLAGNNTSIFAFVSFGYALFSLSKAHKINKKVLYTILMMLSLYSMYLIATKSMFVAVVIAFMFSIRNGFKIKTLFAGTFLLIFFVVSLISIPSVQERVFKNYLRQKVQTAEKLNVTIIPESLLWLNEIAPGRTVIGLSLLFQLVNDNPLNFLFGYGVSGVYEAFGRPPMMHLFSPLGHYGFLGWLVFYLPQLLLAIRILKKRIFNMNTTLFLSVFLYGTLGGFIYGVTSTSLLYALLFALSLKNMKKRNKVYENINNM